MLGVLLKKQFNEKLSFFSRDRKKPDVLGAALALILVAFLIYALVETFSMFVEKYCAVRMNNVLDVQARQFEIMTALYEIVIVVGVLSSVNKLYYSVFESGDRDAFSVLPIKPTTIFASKLLSVYIGQVLIALCVTVSLIAVFASVTKQSAYFVVMSIVAGFGMPVFSIMVASVLCLPYFYLKKYLQNRYILLMAVVTLVIGGCFWLYSEVLGVLESLMATGAIKFVFSEKVMLSIINTTKYLAPSNFIARFVLGIEPMKNLAVFFGTVALSGVVGGLFIFMLFEKAVRLRAEATGRVLLTYKTIRPLKSVRRSLVIREFSTILYTPEYAVQYFSLSAVLPLMVYCCVKLGENVLSSVVMAVDGFELALFVVMLFASLTNTFCATNISRDGKAFCAQKTMPIAFSDIIKSKIEVSSLIYFFSILLSVTVIWVASFVSFAEGCFILFVALLSGIGQICFATRKDLNNPHFTADEDGVLRNGNKNVSLTIAIGLFYALVLGGVSLCVSILNQLKGNDVKWFSYLYCGLLTLVATGVSIAYAFVNIRRSFNQITEDS